MSRLKTFLIYGLIVAAFYFFSNVMVFLSVKGMYKDIGGKVTTKVPTIEITEAKATYINGYVDGRIKNNTENNIENQYVKIAIYSERDVNLGTKYVKIEKLEKEQTQDFHMGYRFKDSYRYEISVVDEIGDATEEQFVSEEMTGLLLLSGILVLCFI